MQPLVTVLSRIAAIRRLTSGSSLAFSFFVMILSPAAGCREDHAVAIALMGVMSPVSFSADRHLSDVKGHMLRIDAAAGKFVPAD